MTNKLQFHELALKEWNKPAPELRDQMKKKLAERLENPHIPSAALWGMENCYKIKLRKAGLCINHYYFNIWRFVAALNKFFSSDSIN